MRKLDELNSTMMTRVEKLEQKNNNWKVRGRDRFGCHAGRQEVSKCRTRGEFQGTCNMYTSAKCVCTPLPSFETQRRRHQKSKTGVYQWPHKKDLCPPNFFLKKGTRRYLTNSKILIFTDLNHLINKFQKYLFLFILGKFESLKAGKLSFIKPTKFASSFLCKFFRVNVIFGF